MSVKIVVVVFVFLHALICVKSQYQNYPGTQNWNSTGRQYHNNTGTQNQKYPGSQYQNYPGVQPQSYPGGQAQNYPGGQTQNYPRGQTQNYPGGQTQNHPGGQYQNYPGGQLPFKQNNFGVPSYNRTTPPSWQNSWLNNPTNNLDPQRPGSSPSPYGKGSANCTFGWCPNANGNPQSSTASNNDRFRPFTSPRPYGSGPANCSFGWCQNGNATRPIHTNTTGYGGRYNTLTSPRPYGNPAYGNTIRPPYNNAGFHNGPQNTFTSPRPYGNPSVGKNNYPVYNNTASKNGPYGVPTNYPYGGSSSNCTFGFCPPTSTFRSPYQQTNYSSNPYGRASTTYRPLYPGNSLNIGPYHPQQNTTAFNPYNPALYNIVQVPRNCPPGSSNVNGACRAVYT